MTNIYDKGDLVRAAVLFTNSNKEPSDPSTVTVKYRIGSGGITAKVYGTDAEVIKDSVGNYHIDLDITSHGKWYYRWEGEGSIVAAVESSFEVIESKF